MPSFALTFLLLLLLHNPANSYERAHRTPDTPKLACNPDNDNLDLRNELKRMEGNSHAVKWEQVRHEAKAEKLKKELDQIDGQLEALENKMKRECKRPSPEGPRPIPVLPRMDPMSMMGPS